MMKCGCPAEWYPFRSLLIAAEREFCAATRHPRTYRRLLPAKSWGLCERHDQMMRLVAEEALARNPIMH